jgi:hypothetical protein
MAAPDPLTVGDAASEDEDDYMNMIIPEVAIPKTKETSYQRRVRKEREAEARGRVKSKEEFAAEEAAQREDALSKSLLSDPIKSANNKGLAMMAKMGFKPGAALGKAEGGRTEPIGINIKEDRGGIGLDSENKRKFFEEVQGETKRIKADEGEFIERIRREREESRLESMVGGAMRVSERMAGEDEEAQQSVAESKDVIAKKRKISTKPLKSINVLWRGLVRRREEKERDRRMRYDLQQSLSRFPTYNDDDEEKEDKKALGVDATQYNLVEDLEEDDPELDEFNALEPAERLQKLVMHLRENYNYCFWCKFKYPDKSMEGCPGLTEEDHD